MRFARAGAAAVTLTDGRILIVGSGDLGGVADGVAVSLDDGSALLIGGDALSFENEEWSRNYRTYSLRYVP